MRLSSVGIVTYHAAYNFGSVLQALGTQIAFEKHGCSASIINYRPSGQRAFYETLYRTNHSLKTLINDLSLISVKSDRLLRAERFERFINQQLNLTECVEKASDLGKFADSFDIYVSGSDQILNIHSNEYSGSDWDAMKPYLLDFTNRRKVSYASSPANMTRDEIKHIVPDLQKFTMLSAREQDAAEMIGQLVGRPCANVLDPTLLVGADSWRRIATRAADEMNLPKKYALIYSLNGTKTVMQQYSLYRRVSDILNMPVVLIAPFAWFPTNKHIVDGRAAGPAEFINIIDHAIVVITDSYYGTLFSMNLGTPFLSMSNGKGSSTRKDQVLHRMQASESIVKGIEDAVHYLERSGIPSVRDITKPLAGARQFSKDYIAHTLDF